MRTARLPTINGLLKDGRQPDAADTAVLNRHGTGGAASSHNERHIEIISKTSLAGQCGLPDPTGSNSRRHGRDDRHSRVCASVWEQTLSRFGVVAELNPAAEYRSLLIGRTGGGYRQRTAASSALPHHPRQRIDVDLARATSALLSLHHF